MDCFHRKFFLEILLKHLLICFFFQLVLFCKLVKKWIDCHAIPFCKFFFNMYLFSLFHLWFVTVFNTWSVKKTFKRLLFSSFTLAISENKVDSFFLKLINNGMRLRRTGIWSLMSFIRVKRSMIGSFFMEPGEWLVVLLIFYDFFFFCFPHR